MHRRHDGHCFDPAGIHPEATERTA